MSATSNKSRIMLFLMVVIALVFFVSSFLAASFSNERDGTTAATGTATQQEGSCIVVRTAQDRLFGECTLR